MWKIVGIFVVSWILEIQGGADVINDVTSEQFQSSFTFHWQFSSSFRAVFQKVIPMDFTFHWDFQSSSRADLHSTGSFRADFEQFDIAVGFSESNFRAILMIFVDSLESVHSTGRAVGMLRCWDVSHFLQWWMAWITTCGNVNRNGVKGRWRPKRRRRSFRRGGGA